jgi:serine/threonine-protein kinase
MSLSPGSRLGRYEILALIGKGGMGEVYRARDSQLQRQVAIKVSEERFSERFEREALAVAALNHPHICTLYDVGPNYLVMEHVDGHMLKSPLPLNQALKYAEEICLALDAAHSKQITHRDLKPANILVTKTGVKLLDFGLARMANAAEASTVTQLGEVMGTPAYMAPEQWAGKAADARTDIYAFGCVLYEMLTGKRAVENRTPVEPAGLERVLKSCLEQDPGERWQSAKDLHHALEVVRLDLSDGVQTRPGRILQSLPWVAATMFAIVASVALWALWSRPAAILAPAATASIDIDLGAPLATTDDPGPDVILSPDGTRIVFIAQGTNSCTSRLMTRLLGGPQPVVLPGTEGAYAPFFSPDGQWVGFFTYGKLQKTRVDGGEPVFLCDAYSGRGGSWGKDDKIVASLDSWGGLSLVDAISGKKTSLTEPRPDEISHRWRQILPGGRKVLFTRSTTFANFEESSIAVLSLEDRTWKTVLTTGGMYPRYLPTGHLIYTTGGRVHACPFDLDSLAIRGPAVRLPEEVSSHSFLGSARLDFSASGNGMFLYRKGKTEGLTTMAWMDSKGALTPLPFEPASFQFPRISPIDSRLLWMVNQGAQKDLWIFDWQNGRKSRLVADRPGQRYPAWSPDARYILFSTLQGICWMWADKATEPKLLIQSQQSQYAGFSFGPEGKWLAYAEKTADGNAGLWIVPVDGSSGQLRSVGTPKLFLKTSSSVAFPAFSPDGRWLAYSSTENGTYEISVTDFPDNRSPYQVSNGGGIIPVWSDNGHELFYRTLSGCENIMVVAYTTNGGVFKTETPKVWSQQRLANTGLAPNFDVAPDGKRSVVLTPATGSEPPEAQSHVTLVINFFDEVRRRAPVGKRPHESEY